MSDKADRSTPALDKLTALKARLSRTDPEFARAQAVEGDAERFCRAVRQSIINARLDAGWDQAELARRVDYSQSTISRLESGKGDLSLKVLFRLAAALGKRPDFALRDGSDDAAATPDDGPTIEVEVLELAEARLWDRLQEAVHESLRDSIDEVKSRRELAE